MAQVREGPGMKRAREATAPWQREATATMSYSNSFCSDLTPSKRVHAYLGRGLNVRDQRLDDHEPEGGHRLHQLLLDLGRDLLLAQERLVEQHLRHRGANAVYENGCDQPVQIVPSCRQSALCSGKTQVKTTLTSRTRNFVEATINMS